MAEARGHSHGDAPDGVPVLEYQHRGTGSVRPPGQLAGMLTVVAYVCAGVPLGAFALRAPEAALAGVIAPMVGAVCGLAALLMSRAGERENAAIALGINVALGVLILMATVG